VLELLLRPVVDVPEESLAPDCELPGVEFEVVPLLFVFAL